MKLSVPCADPQPPATGDVLLRGEERGVSCRSIHPPDDRRCHHRVHTWVKDVVARRARYVFLAPSPPRYWHTHSCRRPTDHIQAAALALAQASKTSLSA